MEKQKCHCETAENVAISWLRLLCRFTPPMTTGFEFLIIVFRFRLSSDCFLLVIDRRDACPTGLHLAIYTNDYSLFTND